MDTFHLQRGYYLTFSKPKVFIQTVKAFRIWLFGMLKGALSQVTHKCNNSPLTVCKFAVFEKFGKYLA